MSARRPFARDRRGVVALELAVVSPVLILLMLGVIEVSLAGWAQATLQMTAAQTARCLGLGAAACNNNPTQFAVNTAQSWLYPNAVTASGVTLQSNATCSGAPGHYARVTLTSHFTGSAPLPGIFGGGTLTATACYFTGP